MGSGNKIMNKRRIMNRMDGKRKIAPIYPPVVLSIAGSDSGGCAGIQADLKTMESLGVFGTCAITSITAQNTMGVDSFMAIPVAEIEAQIDSILSDFEVSSAKTGMLANAQNIEMIAERSKDFEFPLVVDPVMVATSGDALLESGSEGAYKKLIKNSQIVTPNADEAAVLASMEIENVSDSIDAGEKILKMGAENVLVKGGHIKGDTVIDVLVTGEENIQIEHKWIDSEITHGSGCALSSAIAANIAKGETIRDAVYESISFVERALRYPIDVGRGPGSIHHLVDIREKAERQATIKTVRAIVLELVQIGIRPLVPEVGMNIVGSTPYAESVEEMAGVEGRITKTSEGVNIGDGVAFGASDHVARFLKEAREYHPYLRFAMNCKFDEKIELGIRKIGWETKEYSRGDQEKAVRESEGKTMEWGAREVFSGHGPLITKIIDRGSEGKEPMLKLVFVDSKTLISNVKTLLREV
jgi:hydroxymethylpyrimidine/phosphomethylpyrimidine kinase